MKTDVYKKYMFSRWNLLWLWLYQTRTMTDDEGTLIWKFAFGKIYIIGFKQLEAPKVG